MKLSKNQKIGIGILTFMPILCFIGYIVSFFVIFFGEIATGSDGGFEQNGASSGTFFTGFAMAFVFLILAIFSGLAAMILHIVHITKNEKLKAQSNGQLLWILVIVFANGIGGVIYFFIEILPEPKPNPVLRKTENL